jgi:pre-rRNA-processing protein TSR3
MIPSVNIVMMKQDDPAKCTAARMVRFGLARAVRRIHPRHIILDPYADRVLLPGDRNKTICAVDCSWRLAAGQFRGAKSGRRLPPLLAGNPTNYSKIGMLSTAEAISSALFITGSRDAASAILDKFRWGHTFLELNSSILEEYSEARSSADVLRISESYGLSATSPAAVDGSSTH